MEKHTGKKVNLLVSKTQPGQRNAENGHQPEGRDLNKTSHLCPDTAAGPVPGRHLQILSVLCCFWSRWDKAQFPGRQQHRDPGGEGAPSSEPQHRDRAGLSATRLVSEFTDPAAIWLRNSSVWGTREAPCKFHINSGTCLFLIQLLITTNIHLSQVSVVLCGLLLLEEHLNKH